MNWLYIPFIIIVFSYDVVSKESKSIQQIDKEIESVLVSTSWIEPLSGTVLPTATHPNAIERLEEILTHRTKLRQNLESIDVNSYQNLIEQRKRAVDEADRRRLQEDIQRLKRKTGRPYSKAVPAWIIQADKDRSDDIQIKKLADECIKLLRNF